MRVGDLIRFGHIYNGCDDLNGRLAVYLGEDFIHRDDGVTIENHKVLLVGASKPSCIDRCLLNCMTVETT